MDGARTSSSFESLSSNSINSAWSWRTPAAAGNLSGPDVTTYARLKSWIFGTPNRSSVPDV
eukprot:1551598-Amphidinium_carterae.1